MKKTAAFLFSLGLAAGTYYAVIFPAGIKEFLWYCNIALFVSAVGFWRQDSRLISAVLLTAVPSQFFWIIANIMNASGGPAMGRSQWLPQQIGYPGFIIEVLYHFTLIPVCAFGVWKYGYDRRAARWATLIFLPMLVLTRLAAKPWENNINCMFFPCDMKYSQELAEAFGTPYALRRIAGFMVICGVLHLIAIRLLPDANFKPKP